MSGLSSWYRDWKPYFKSRARQSVSQLWGCITVALFLIVVFIAILYITGHYYKVTGESEMLTSEIIILIAVFFIWYFCLVFILSLHPKTRKIADRLFGFIERTELEELKLKVGNIEKELQDIKNRFESIEATLKGLASKKRRGRKNG